jgi:hypothetical protein
LTRRRGESLDVPGDDQGRKKAGNERGREEESRKGRGVKSESHDYKLNNKRGREKEEG